MAPVVDDADAADEEEVAVWEGAAVPTGAAKTMPLLLVASSESRLGADISADWGAASIIEVDLGFNMWVIMVFVGVERRRSSNG